MLAFSPSTAIVSFGDGDDTWKLTSKDTVVKNVELCQSYDDVVEITMTLICPAGKFTQDFYPDECGVKKISKKQVEDCTVNELLYAARYKVKNEYN